MKLLMHSAAVEQLHHWEEERRPVGQGRKEE
jgi:hypothetical protein